jgi:hypothetical protein
VNRKDPPDDVDPVALAVAVDHLVEAFVHEDKRDRVRKMLLGRSKKGGGWPRRDEAFEALLSWIPAEYQSELDRDRLAALIARSGAQAGIQILDRSTYRATVAEPRTNDFASVFVPDDGSFAIVYAEVGPPTLCTKPKRR